MTYHTLDSIKDKLEQGDFVEIYGGMAGPKLFAGYCTEKYSNALVLQEMRRTAEGEWLEGRSWSGEFTNRKCTAIIYKAIK